MDTLNISRSTLYNMIHKINSSYYHSLFIADLIKLNVHPLIHIFTSPENTLNDVTMDQLGIDLIVTDSELPIQFRRSTLLISSFPTKKELDNLHRSLVNMID